MILILLIICIVLFIFYYNNKNEQFEITQDIILPKSHINYNNTNDYLNKILNDTFFSYCQYHKDYIDVLNAFNDYDGLSPHDKQLFNINNIPVTIEKDIRNNQELLKINSIIKNFINELNAKIKNNQISSSFNSINGWNNKYTQDYNDPFKNYMTYLGLPPSLYNEEIKGTDIKLKKYFNISKYSTESEIKYICYILITRELSDDDLLIKVTFILDKSLPKNILIENIDVIGVLSHRKVSSEYSDINQFYNFESLNENNMVDTSNLMNELAYKQLIRQKLANEQIENLNEIDKETHNNINPYEYQSYKNTRTIYNDILGTKSF